MSNGSSITVEITGGPSISVPWFAGMNAQQALEGAFNQGAGSLTYALQYYGSNLGYLVMMINETFDSFNSTAGASATPFFYWEFLINNTPASAGIDSTILNAGDVVGFNFEMYVPEQHEQSLLRFKHEFQTGASARDTDKT